MRKIIIVGNCQAIAIFDVYKIFIRPVISDNIIFIHVGDERTAVEEENLRTADIVIEQIHDAKQPFNLDDMEINGRLVRVPHLSGRFLFPFAETRHPRDAPVPYRDQGPFPASDTDMFINKMMREGVEADTAIQRYLDLDVETAGRLARTYDLSMSLQRQRDAQCGTDFAGLIEANFREQDCFCTAYHPKLPIVRHVLSYIFDQIEVPRALADRTLASLSRTPHALGETPIHPKVAAYFGLKFYHPGRTFVRFTGERLTLQEFWRGYINYTWNNDLLVGIARADEQGLSAQECQQLIDGLRRGLAAAPGGSPDASDALARLLERSGDLPAAVSAARQAVAGEPGHPPFVITLARLLLRLRQLDEAEETACQAIRLGPAYVEAHRILRDVLSASRRLAEAATAAQDVIDIDPRREHDWCMLSDLAIRLGQTDRAAAVLEQALDRFPQGAVVLGGLAALRHHQMRLEDAVAIARASIAISPVHFEVHGRLADCLTRLGREAEAETVLRAMITRFPKIPTPYQQLGRICIRQDRLPEAEEWLQNAVTLDPDFIESRTQLANVLIRLQRPSDAEAVLRGSRAVDESAELLLALANLRATAGNVEEAIAWASKAAAAPLHNLAANRFVWDQLVAMPDLPRAAEFLLGQIARGKHLADLTLLLARTYRHMEQHEQAMQCYRQAAEAMEQNSRLLREYVDYLLVIGQEAVARRFVARRQAMFPNDALVRLSMGIVLLRTNEREAARREFEIASQLDPHDGGIARYLKMTEPVEVSG